MSLYYSVPNKLVIYMSERFHVLGYTRPRDHTENSLGRVVKQASLKHSSVGTVCRVWAKCSVELPRSVTLYCTNHTIILIPDVLPVQSTSIMKCSKYIYSNKMFTYKCVVDVVFLSFLGAFAQFGKATISSSYPSVRPSAWNSAPTGRICINFDILSICRKSVGTVQAWIKSGKNNGYFTWILMQIYIISLSVLLRMRNVWDKSCRENKNTHFMLNNLFERAPFMW
jgi:hypothetical protein